jgi:hypothetical protein
MMVYADVRVTGNKEEVQALLLALATVSYLCDTGASRRIVLDVDGDGSANLSFELRGHDITPEPIVLPEDHCLRAAIRDGGDIPNFSIGE